MSSRARRSRANRPRDPQKDPADRPRGRVAPYAFLGLPRRRAGRAGAVGVAARSPECCSSHASIAEARKRSCRPSRTHGIRPASTSSYTQDRVTLRSSQTWSTVTSSSRSRIAAATASVMRTPSSPRPACVVLRSVRPRGQRHGSPPDPPASAAPVDDPRSRTTRRREAGRRRIRGTAHRRSAPRRRGRSTRSRRKWPNRRRAWAWTRLRTLILDGWQPGGPATVWSSVRSRRPKHRHLRTRTGSRCAPGVR